MASDVLGIAMTGNRVAGELLQSAVLKLPMVQA
ncbi:hypothetical protein J2W68_000262 [Luteimonas terrae]|uniref:Uncharacterized protein n=1 Tax=Luteimonas terrae TaxID=1530191 RepID=A0ABU1XS47_9GAMM|nr:hypothetical protein [Luteimonas terrae]